MQCNERERLWEEYNRALDEFSTRTDELSPLVSDVKVFRKKVLECKEANEKCKAARTAWANHLQDHGCDQGGK
jgi:hypothetical protein